METNPQALVYVIIVSPTNRFEGRYSHAVFREPLNNMNVVQRLETHLLGGRIERRYLGKCFRRQARWDKPV